MTLGKLTGLERQKILDELDELSKKITELEAILADENKIHGIIRDELAEIRRKYSDDRRTAIESVSGEVDIEDLIPVEDCVVTYTNIGYIKRMPADSYKTQKRGGRGVSGMKQREEDIHSHSLSFALKGGQFLNPGVPRQAPQVVYALWWTLSGESASVGSEPGCPPHW